MGYYANELREATTFINEESFSKVLTKIKEEVNTDRWKGFGWRDAVLKSETLEEALEEFSLQLEEVEEGNYRPVIHDVYVSFFFDYLIHIVAPYVTNGEIQVEHDYGSETIVFEDGQVQIW